MEAEPAQALGHPLAGGLAAQGEHGARLGRAAGAADAERGVGGEVEIVARAFERHHARPVAGQGDVIGVRLRLAAGQVEGGDCLLGQGFADPQAQGIHRGAVRRAAHHQLLHPPAGQALVRTPGVAFQEGGDRVGLGGRGVEPVAGGRLERGVHQAGGRVGGRMDGLGAGGARRVQADQGDGQPSQRPHVHSPRPAPAGSKAWRASFHDTAMAQLDFGFRLARNVPETGAWRRAVRLCRGGLADGPHDAPLKHSPRSASGAWHGIAGQGAGFYWQARHSS